MVASPRTETDSMGSMEVPSDALYGAWLAGVGVSSATVHSRLCQALVDAFGLVHAEVNCVMLPYTAAHRRDSAFGALQKAAAAMQTEDIPQALYELAQLASARKSLGQMDVRRNELEALCDRIEASGDDAFANRAECLAILTAAHEGRPP